MNVYPPRRWAHMRRVWAAWSLDRLEACNITQTLAPARSTKSEPRDALSDACNMTSRDDAAAGENEGPPFAVPGLHGGMLTGGHGWSPRLATEPYPESRSLSDIERRGSDSGESVSVPSESRAAAATAKAMTATSTAVMSDIVLLPSAGRPCRNQPFGVF